MSMARRSPGKIRAQALPPAERPAPSQAGPVVIEGASHYRGRCGRANHRGIGLILLADDPLRPYRHRINLEQHPRQRERGHAAQRLGRQPVAETGV